ncbi:MAG: hypothetical protein HQK77_20265 [Desulfobacterales bacterium]|nr:hypothetical protein [Desulfobacterales bacterium]
MTKKMIKLSISCICIYFLFIQSIYGLEGFNIVHTSKNMEGYIVSAECNPGGGSNCPCSDDDVLLESFVNYGEVTANPHKRNTWVNAIGGTKFIENMPDGSSVIG